MRKLIILAISVFVAIAMSPTAAAGSPHFVGGFTVEATDSSLTVSGKEAGLGNEEQVEIQLTADALCINPGKKHPKADNKESASAVGEFPVQNGKANFTLTATATFQPNCSPPMTVVWTNIVVTDLTNGISKSIPGTY